MRPRTALLLAPLVLSGCAMLSDVWGYKVALEEAQRRYTHHVRWGEFNRAREYVDPEWQESFRARRSELERFHFTDFEVQSFDVDRARRSATVVVVYHGYHIDSVTGAALRETQEWVRAGVAREWRVRPSLEAGSGAGF